MGDQHHAEHEKVIIRKKLFKIKNTKKTFNIQTNKTEVQTVLDLLQEQEEKKILIILNTK